MIDEEVNGLQAFATLLETGDKDLIYRTAVAFGRFFAAGSWDLTMKWNASVCYLYEG